MPVTGSPEPSARAGTPDSGPFPTGAVLQKLERPGLLSVSGLRGSAPAFSLAAAIARTQGPLLWIVPNRRSLDQRLGELRTFLGGSRPVLAYPDWEQPGIGRWAAVHRATGAVIGFAGLKYLPELGVVDLGYRFLPAFWGRGLATEASRACLAYGFETLGLERVIGLTDPENQASMRVLEKVGMLPEGALEYHGQPASLFAIDVTRHRALSGQ